MTWASLIASTLALVLVGGAFYRSAVAALRRRTSNMDTLIAMGATVAWGYSVAATLGHWLGIWGAPAAVYFMESSGLLALISLGHWLEARSRDRAGDSIRALMTLAPPTALRLDDADLPHEIPASEVGVGDRVLVLPGQRVPVDGVIVGGQSAVNESMVTGEPLPVLRSPGDEVIGGTISTDGRLTVRATRVGAQTALAQIVSLVESAQSTKPPVQRLADRIAAVFVPAVLCVALATAVGWYAWGALHGWNGPRIGAQIANATCSVLIIACPCALGLAVPAALMVGIGLGARRGILIRDIDALQMAQRIDTVVLDKTGTLTMGNPSVETIVPVDGLSQDQLLELAASVEQFSAHPLAKAIVARARSNGAVLAEPRSFTSEAGLGVIAELAGRQLLVGSDALLSKFGFKPTGDARPGTFVNVAQNVEGTVTPLGMITFADPLKPQSREAIAQLHRMKLRTMLLSGDTQDAADSVARAVGIEEARGGVKPDQKAQIIRALREGSQKSVVAMVGDGINDAPALATADLGIAIGSGSDVAKETGGIVLVGANLLEVAHAIALSRATMRIIRQNLFLAFIYNVLAIPLAALGLLNPLIAAAAMAASDVTVLGNALRLRRARLD
jgi:Cu+-exporting ATPase